MIGTIIKPLAISAYVIKKEHGAFKFLLIRRCSKILTGTWQMVTGGIEKGETATQAALREIFEETGLKPARFYTADILEKFYYVSNDIIYLNPVFVAFIEEHQEVILSPHEHDAFQWVSIDEALKLLDFSEHKRIIRHIEENFIKQTPFEYLRIS